MGKDLSHFCTPVYLNEPLSMLQRLAENFQYSDLLNKAATETNQYLRIALIASFGLSAYAFNKYRTLKSFNPILGETFEYFDNELDVRLHCEQVSHHPPISACFAEGNCYNIYSNTHAETKFMLMKGCLEFIPVGKTIVNLLNFQETYVYTKPKIGVKNLIFGKMFLDRYGNLEVKNLKTEDTLNIELFEEGNKHKHGDFKGTVKDNTGCIKLKIEGNLMEKLDVAYPSNPNEEEVRQTIWKRFDDENSNDESKYFFTNFIANLNYLNDELKECLPPTDSRFRTDQRALEEQNIEFAEEEKKRLEQKQRETRKLREKDGIEYQSMYFKKELDELSKESIYKNSGDYWGDRIEKNFTKFKDIFS